MKPEKALFMIQTFIVLVIVDDVLYMGSYSKVITQHTSDHVN